MNPYENLANAIIVLAAEDYRQALHRCHQHSEKEAYKQDKASIERFFRSDWFGDLTSLEPEVLIRKLCEEAV